MDNEERERRKLEKRIRRFRADQQETGGISAWEGLSLLGSLGFVVAGSLIIGLGIGVYLDRRWHTQPWLTLTGLVFGLAAAAFGAYELIRTFLRGNG